jgi:hypothetical protein
MSLTEINFISTKYDTMSHVDVVGEDRAGNAFRLPVKQIIANSWGRSTTIVVELYSRQSLWS